MQVHSYHTVFLVLVLQQEEEILKVWLLIPNIHVQSINKSITGNMYFILN